MEGAGAVEPATTLAPAEVAALVDLQADWYARHWGFGPAFRAELAQEIGDFAAALPHPDCRSWLLRRGSVVLGGITIDGRDRPQARLRWFFLAEGERGGLGSGLLEQALGFCRDRGFATVWLSTFAGLDAARRLYAAAGFRTEHAAPDSSWGVEVLEQRMRLTLAPRQGVTST
jgi:GNAT superfamily N-acetyltransferase